MDATPDKTSEPLAPRAALIALAAVFGVMVAATVALWAIYGKTVFFEMILAGLAACF